MSVRFDPVRWAERRRSSMQIAAELRRRRSSRPADTDEVLGGEPVLTRQSIAPNSVYRAESRESRGSAENDQPRKNWEWTMDSSTKPNTASNTSSKPPSSSSSSSRKPPVPYQVKRREGIANLPSSSTTATARAPVRPVKQTVTSTRKIGPPPQGHSLKRQARPNPPPPLPPKSDSNDPVTRQMIDRDTLRLRNKVLFEKGIRYWRKNFQIPPSKSSSANISMLSNFSSTDSQHPIKVFVRKRPMFVDNGKESAEYDVVWVPESDSIVLHNCLFQADLKTAYITHSIFKFDGCFDESSTNESVFESCEISSMLHDAMNKGNVCTIFMFGQTGSGKTYTMTAIEEFVCGEIFSHSPNPPRVSLEFVELCGKKVFDLLLSERGDSLKLREKGDGSLIIDGVSRIDFFDSANSLNEQIKFAHARRRTESTGANSVSSRSHAVCVLRFPETGGKLVLVDLAGSERRKDSMWHDKERQREGAEINASLHALKECIRWRVMRQQGNGPPAPFRLSSLTRILAEAFTSTQSRLSVIATVSPCATDIEHTMSTLKAVYALTNRKAITEVKQTELNKIVEEVRGVGSGRKYLSVPPKKWTYEEICEWQSSVVGETEQPSLFPKGTTGLMVIRMSESRFVQMYGEKFGIKLYRNLHDLISGRISEN